MKILREKKYSILSNILKYSFVIVFAFSIISSIAFAATGSNTGTTVSTTIENPLNSEIDTIPKFIEAVLKIVLTVGVPIVALAIIYTGFLFVKAQGKPEELTKAKQSLLYTLIGAALLLGAFVIANAVVSTVEDIKSTT